MTVRHFVIAAASAVVLFAAGAASAAEYRPFSRQDFAAAQAAGKPIVVDVFATWCPTCKAQEPIMKQLSSAPKFDKLLIFRLDFDTQKPEWRKFKVWRQSTFIAFRGRRETGRSIAETDPEALERLLDTTIQ